MASIFRKLGCGIGRKRQSSIKKSSEVGSNSKLQKIQNSLENIDSSISVMHENILRNQILKKTDLLTPQKIKNANINPNFDELDKIKIGTQIVIGREKFTIRKILGKGSFGMAFKVESKGHISVIKIIDKKMQCEEDVLDEYNIQAQLNHPNILSVQGLAQNQDFYFIQMEYVDGVDLYAILHEGKSPYPTQPFNQDRYNLFKDELISALKECHKKNIYHLDIKPENILITSDLHVKLIDFGLSVQVAGLRSDVLDDVFGTPEYLPPEINKWYRTINEDTIDSVESFALGVVLLQAKTNGQDGLEEALKVGGGRYIVSKYHLQVAQSLPDSEDKDLIIKLLSNNPELRPRIKEL